jgi:hypothetical protein
MAALIGLMQEARKANDAYLTRVIEEEKQRDGQVEHTSKKQRSEEVEEYEIMS